LAGLPHIDLDLEARAQRLVLDAHAEVLLTAAHDLADGGLAVALAEMCLAAGAGFEPAGGDAAPDLGDRLDAALFGEAQSRFLVAVADQGAAAALEEMALAAHVPAVVLGRVAGDRIRLGPVDVPLSAARDAYGHGLERALA